MIVKSNIPILHQHIKIVGVLSQKELEQVRQKKLDGFVSFVPIMNQNELIRILQGGISATSFASSTFLKSSELAIRRKVDIKAHTRKIRCEHRFRIHIDTF
jgi:hypothetical protein